VEERDLVRWRIEPLERRRRGVDERIAVAAPWLSRRMRAATRRLPAGSRLRRAALTRAVRTGYAATNRDDYAAMQAPLHPEVEFFPPERGRGGLGFDAVYRGPDGVAHFVSEWKSGFSRFTYEPREIADAGGDSFAVRLGMVGALRDAETEVRDEYGIVVTLKDGQIFRLENFRDWSTALAALAGAAPPGESGA
jgi:ketosteroid isomerase-like protein